MGIQRKSTIASIYGQKIAQQQYTRHAGGEKEIMKMKINTFQLCVESELILRHYDRIRKGKKRWFFSPVNTIINDIEKLKI